MNSAYSADEINRLRISVYVSLFLPSERKRSRVSFQQE
jgi:hypothetical protein